MFEHEDDRRTSHRIQSNANLPVAVVVRSAIAVPGLIAVAPIEVGQYERPFRFVEQVFGRVRVRYLRGNSGSIDNDIFLFLRNHINGILDIATRLGHRAIDATVPRTTVRPSIRVAPKVERLSAIIKSGVSLVTHGPRSGTLCMMHFSVVRFQQVP